MTELVDCFGNFVITYGADLVLCAVLCAGRFLVDDPIAVAVSLCRNYCLSNENFVTYRAVLTFGETGFGAGRCNSGVNDFGVSCCRYNSISITVAAD